MSLTTEQQDDLDTEIVTEDNVESLIEKMGKPSEDASVLNEEEAIDANPVESAEVQAEVKAEDPPAQPVIKTRDGQHDIPYSVLENERRRAADLQRQLNELLAAKASQGTQTSTKDPAETGLSAETDEQELVLFEEEFGKDAAEAERKRRERYAKLEQRQKELEQEVADSRKWREAQKAKSEQDELSEINATIDSIPELQSWRDSGDPMWDAAVALDNRLQKDPAFQNKPLRDRFNAVVEKLTGRKANKIEPDQDALLDKKLSESAQRSRIAPSSLSDLPGGHVPDQSEYETLERLSTSQIGAKFERMTPEQQNEYLARL